MSGCEISGISDPEKERQTLSPHNSPISPSRYEIMDRFLKLSEVQTMLAVSRSTLWRWIAEKGLKVIRVGNVKRIRESDLQAFLERHQEAREGGKSGKGRSKIRGDSDYYKRISILAAKARKAAAEKRKLKQKRQ